MSTDLPGSQPGVIFIGATDAGVLTGAEVTDRLLQTLSDMKTDGKIVPPPTLTAERRLLNGAPVAVVSVWPADAPPVRYEGRPGYGSVRGGDSRVPRRSAYSVKNAATAIAASIPDPFRAAH